MKCQSSLLWYLLLACGIILTFAAEANDENKNIQADKDVENEKELNLGTEHADEGISQEYYFNRIHTARLEGSTGETVYWVNLYIGSPPQKQTAIIDTGSSLLAFPCEECKSNCGKHLSKKYDLKQSISSQKMACDAQFGKFKCSRCRADPDNTIKGKSISETGICDWGVSYVEGSSISGFMAVDYVALGDEMQDYLDQKASSSLAEDTESEYLTYIQHERVQIPFGCTTQETNLFLTQKPDGIIGLGPSSNEMSHPPNIIDQIFSAHLKNGESHVFSLCLNAQAGGFMSVGGYNHELHERNVGTKIINFSPSSGFYDVHLTKITVKHNDQSVVNIFVSFDFLRKQLGDVSIECGGYQPIIDSGTTLVYGPAQLMNQLLSAVNKQCNMQEKYLCGRILLFDFRNNDNTIVTIEWTADGYLYVDPSKNNPNLYQLAFEGYPTGNKVYLSGPFMKNYDILFDKNKQEIHFTRSNCTLPHINSVLMNMHSHKIRQTAEDKKFIDDLIKFQQDFNYTQPKFKKDNTTQQINNEIKNNDIPKNTTNSDNNNMLDAERGTDITAHEPSTIQKVLLYGGLLIILVFALVCCKRSLKPIDVVEEHEEIPLTKVQIPQEKINISNFSAVQRNRRLEMIVEDKDEALRSEEDNEFGYKNDASYNVDDSTRRDLEGQFGHLDEDHEEGEDVDEDNEHKHALEQ